MLNFPCSILKPVSFRLDIVGSVVSGGITAGGQQQRVSALGGGLWALQLEFNTLRTPDQIRTWRALQYGQLAGVVPVNVSICDLRQAPRPSNWMPAGGVPHSDGTSFGDDTLYIGSTIGAAMTADAALRATTITVEFSGDAEPLGGEYFSMSYGEGMHELHVVTSVAENGDGYDIGFTPPLRAAHSSGDALNFDNPTGTFVMASPDAMAMATEMGRRGTGQATFIEYVG